MKTWEGGRLVAAIEDTAACDGRLFYLLGALRSTTTTIEEMNMTRQARRQVIVETRKRRPIIVSPREATGSQFITPANVGFPPMPIDHAVAAIAIPAANRIGNGDMDTTLIVPDFTYRLVRSEEMPTAGWIDCRDNPRQRDVKERLAKGRATHLFKFDEAHRRVTVGVILGNGGTYKVDGHTRAYVWKNGLSNYVPDTVFVDVYECKDISAVKDLYDKFDNELTGDTGPDRVTGAAKECDIAFDSPMMRGGEISTAVRSLWHFLEKTRPKRIEKSAVITNAMKRFARELQLLDACGPTKKRFPVCVVMAAIMTIRGDQDAAIQFWKNYADGLSEKVGGQRDAIAVFEDRLPGILKSGNGTKERDAMCEAIAAIRAYSLGRGYTIRSGYKSATSKELREYATKAFGGV